MIGLIQRVKSAQVTVEGETTASIQVGLLVLVGFQADDQPPKIPRFVERVTEFRIFSDKNGKMNQSVQDKEGEILWVPQFTLVADTRSGRRPSFSNAAPPPAAVSLFDALMTDAKAQFPCSQFGQFGAHMEVSLTNNGPVTFWIEE